MLKEIGGSRLEYNYGFISFSSAGVKLPGDYLDCRKFDYSFTFKSLGEQIYRRVDYIFDIYLANLGQSLKTDKMFTITYTSMLISNDCMIGHKGRIKLVPY